MLSATRRTSATLEREAIDANSSDETSLVGRVLGTSYRIVRWLDEGGMGTVVEAEHLRLRRPVAVKLLPARLSHPRAVARFRREAEILAQLEHPHVVRVFDFDVSDHGEPYLIMELLQGESLAARFDRGGIGMDEVVRYVREIASGLTAAHAAGTVHRDLKPANVFLADAGTETPVVKLLDFGVSRSAHANARLTDDHIVIGTPNYMAPEQAAGHSHGASPRADQYSLAVITFELLAGRPPFEGDDLPVLLDRIISAPPPILSSVAPAVTPLVDAVLARALEKDPGRRYPTVAAFAEAFAAAVERGRCATGTPPPRPEVDTEASVPLEEASSLSRDARRLIRALDAARQSLALGETELAARYVEAALQMGHELDDPVARSILNVSAPLIEQVFANRVGRLDRRIRVCAEPSTSTPLCPELAYVLSRAEDGMTVEELIDASGLRIPDVSRLLTYLLHHGWLSLEPPAPVRNRSDRPHGATPHACPSGPRATSFPEERSGIVDWHDS